YTDGVNEAFSVDDEEYGNDRLEAFLDDHKDLRPRTMVEELRADVARWAEGAEQSDDITILSLEYGVAPEVQDGRTYVATIDNVQRAIDFINAELDRRMCPPRVQNRIDIALEELLVNICHYAYADQDEPGKMEVKYVYKGSPSSITVELKDQGVPFNPLEHADPDRSLSFDEIEVGGLGIYMVKKSMDDIAYVYDDGSNVLAFRKTW
ncbi:MAG: ATP-binding protein, partial [Coriobacteriales bacterium]|nr:ATP-binding protein [Coriobacteriales bacterium]